MLEKVQIILEDEEAKFAVIPYEDYLRIRDLLGDKEKLEDYLDYLHTQKVKVEVKSWHTLQAVKESLGLDES
ncbi:MAG: hypothetical protein KF893_19340 [Caldilineaceae bacterium]|nr:hypothetical protein [Caldilineaceae bacterium]